MIHFKEVILGLQEEPVDVTMRVLRASGICAVIPAWLTIAIGIYRNPWFVLTRNAFSDLGGPRAADPWIYDSGMLITAALLMAFSAYLLATSRNGVESMGASFASIAGIFLALIGIFHEGTHPHAFVSTWFFVQMDIAIGIWGIGGVLARSRHRRRITDSRRRCANHSADRQVAFISGPRALRNFGHRRVGHRGGAARQSASAVSCR